MELRRYLKLARRWLWMLLLATLVAAVVAYVVSSRQTKLYRATATLIINQGQSAAGPSYSDVLASQQLAKSYASVATSRPVLAAAAKSLGFGNDAPASSCACLKSGRSIVLRVSAAVPPNTQLITIDGISASPGTAASGANAVAGAFSDAIRQSQLGDTGSAEQDLNKQIQDVKGSIQKTTEQLQAASTQRGGSSPAASADLSILQSQLTQDRTTLATLADHLEQIKLSQARATTAVKLIEPAIEPAGPFSPRTLLNVGLAALLGFGMAVGLGLLLEYLDDRVQSPSDVNAATGGAATLGIIEQLGARERGSDGLSDSLLLGPTIGFSGALEAYRLLRSNLDFACAEGSVKALAVTSARAGEGKTTTAANLAIVLSQTGKRVLLVDADLRRPVLHRLFGLPNSAGLSTMFLMAQPEVEPLARQTQYEHMSILTSGPLPPNPTELLSSVRMRQVVSLCKRFADVVVFDGPPLLVVADASEIAAKVDGVVIVVDSSRTRPAELTHARAALERASATLLGIVLNKFQPRQAGADYYGYSYTYEDYRPQKGASGARRGRGAPSGLAGTVSGPGRLRSATPLDPRRHSGEL